MKLNDAIKLSCDFLDLEQLKSKIGAQEVDDESVKQLNKLLCCANLAYEEIVTEYLPILHTEMLDVTNGQISFNLLSKPICGIISVQDENGSDIKYSLSADHISLSAQKATITYQTIPSALAYGAEVSVLFPERLLAYGIAREYLFLQDKSDEALIFEKRFKDGLTSFVRKKSALILPRRRWHA